MKAESVFWIIVSALAAGYIAICYQSVQPEPVLRGFYPACVSDSMLTQYRAGNEAMQRELVDSGNCIGTTNIQYEYLVIGEGSQGVKEVKVFLPDDESVVLFMPKEAVQ